MTLQEALKKEFDSGRRLIYATKPSECHICHAVTRCHAGVCFDDKNKIETDMIDVWEIANPDNKWPYKWAETDPLPEPQPKDKSQLRLFPQKRRRGA